MGDQYASGIQYVDMSDNTSMKNDAISEAKKAVSDPQTEERKVSKHLKQFFDEKYGPNWHCIVGKHFNSHVSYESKHFIFFYEGQMAILLYKKG